MVEDGSKYSFAWSGAVGIDLTVDVLRNFNAAENVTSLFNYVDNLEFYGTISQNLILAFANGDIAYILGASLPIRKSKNPYSGCRVLDGTKSDDDWIGWVMPKDLPRVINPKKGYIVTANNRQMPDNVGLDHGAAVTSTIRA
jgi:penicillin G amidase